MVTKTLEKLVIPVLKAAPFTYAFIRGGNAIIFDLRTPRFSIFWQVTIDPEQELLVIEASPLFTVPPGASGILERLKKINEECRVGKFTLVDQERLNYCLELPYTPKLTQARFEYALYQALITVLTRYEGLRKAAEPPQESFTSSSIDAIIPKPMPSLEGENGYSLVQHISDLQSHAKLGSERKERPSHYPHENVPYHAPKLVEEGKTWELENKPAQQQHAPRNGVIYEEGQTPKIGTTEAGATQSYEIVTTLRQVAEKTGVERDEILTTRDIEAEYHINKKLVHEYTRRGRQGRPHLTPLPVRLPGGRGGQLLFRREDIERLVANPPKPGPPRK